MDTKGNQMKILPSVIDIGEPVTSDFFYDLCNGYLDPRGVLDDPRDPLLVDLAVKILKDFEDSLQEAGLVG